MIQPNHKLRNRFNDVLISDWFTMSNDISLISGINIFQITFIKLRNNKLENYEDKILLIHTPFIYFGNLNNEMFLIEYKFNLKSLGNINLKKIKEKI